MTNTVKAKVEIVANEMISEFAIVGRYVGENVGSEVYVGNDVVGM